MRCEKIVGATIAVHKEVAARFLPSAVKFHYNFNMRDLSAIFEGMCERDASSTTNDFQIARLWLHECSRVYADRLVTVGEIVRCGDIFVEVGKRFLDNDPELLFREPCVFTAFAGDGQMAAAKDQWAADAGDEEEQKPGCRSEQCGPRASQHTNAPGDRPLST